MKIDLENQLLENIKSEISSIKYTTKKNGPLTIVVSKLIYRLR